MGVPDKQQKINFINLGLGAGLNIFEVSTLGKYYYLDFKQLTSIQLFAYLQLGQPFEVLKTHLAANRSDSLLTGVRKTFQRGGFVGFYQGLIPWCVVLLYAIIP